MRTPQHPINKLFVDRWSPRAMSGEKVPHEELMTLFEAARWAPSSFNGQPWRFIYAPRDSEYWNDFLNLLVEFNQTWAKNAGALVIVASKKTFEKNGKPARTHSFDAGSAWQNLALQGTLSGLVVHGMEGFNYDKAQTVAELSDDYTVEAMIAIGKPGKKEDLPPDIAKREEPSDRKKLSEIIFEGKIS